MPPQAIVIPAFQLVAGLGLINNFAALFFTYLSWCPVGIFILRAFFKSLPEDLYDAAKVDGASSFRTFWQIALPLAKPALATVSIFYFVWVWNDFLYPLLYLQKDTMSTIPMGLMLFNGRYQTDWGMQTAALVHRHVRPSGLLHALPGQVRERDDRRRNQGLDGVHREPTGATLCQVIDRRLFAANAPPGVDDCDP